MRLPSASRLSAPLVLLLTCAHAAIVVNASKPPAAPQPLSFAAGGRSPDGRALAINSRYLTVDGQPWFPVMGEFQYSRYPAEAWETELLKMKAGGVRIVSTYIFWIHHEEVEGQFDWSGRRDLRRFVELAGRHGLMVWARVGPWNHGEVRNGGLPDWVLRKSATRRNDPAYLKSVARFYGQIGGQFKGLFWKDGGPIVGVQIENEYHETRPRRGRGAHPHAQASRPRGRPRRALLLRHRLGQRRRARARRDPGLRRLSRWLLVPPAQRAPAQPQLFLHAYPLRGKRRPRPLLRCAPTSTPASAAIPFLTAEMGGGMDHRLSSPSPDVRRRYCRPRHREAWLGRDALRLLHVPRRHQSRWKPDHARRSRRPPATATTCRSRPTTSRPRSANSARCTRPSATSKASTSSCRTSARPSPP